jgi:hypothetical protein
MCLIQLLLPRLVAEWRARTLFPLDFVAHQCEAMMRLFSRMHSTDSISDARI